MRSVKHEWAAALTGLWPVWGPFALYAAMLSCAPPPPEPVSEVVKVGFVDLWWQGSFYEPEKYGLACARLSSEGEVQILTEAWRTDGDQYLVTVWEGCGDFCVKIGPSPWDQEVLLLQDGEDWLVWHKKLDDYERVTAGCALFE